MAISGGDGSIILNTKVDTTGISKAGNTIKGALKGAGVAVAAVGAAIVGTTAAFIAGAKETAAYGDRVDKLSQKIGMAKKSFQQWDYIMQINGSSIETLQMGMKTLSTAAQNGSDAFDKLGLSQEFVKSASPEELFESTVSKLQEMGESTERTALASELLGRSATELAPLLNSSADSVEALKQQAIDYGFVMSDEAVAASAAFTDSLTTLGMTTTGLKNKMMAEFLPALTSITDGLALLMTGDMSGLDQINEGITGFVDKISQIMPQLLQIGGSIITSLVSGISANLPTLLNGIISLLPQLLSTIANLITHIAMALPQLMQTIVSALPTIIQTIVTALPTMIPALINGIVQAIVILVGALPQIIQPIIDNLPMIITSITGALLDNLPILIMACIQLVIAIVAALPQIIDSLLGAIGGIAIQIGQTLFKTLPKPVQNAFKSAFDLLKVIWDKVQPYFAIIWEGIKAVFSVVGEVLGGYFEVAWKVIQAVWDTATGYFSAIWDTIAGIFSVVGSVLSGNWSDAWEAIKGIVNTWANFFSGVWESIKSVFSAVGSWFTGIFSAAWNGIKNVWSAVGSFFSGIWESIKSVFSAVGSWFTGIFSAAWNGIKNVWSAVGSFFSGIINTIKSIFQQLPSQLIAIGKNMVNGLWNGIQNAKNWLLGKIKQWCGSILNGIKSFFGIHSPSTVMRDEVGKQIPAGMAIGIEKAKTLVTKATKALITDTRSEVQKVLDDMNEEMLESEKLYAEESIRLKDSTVEADKEYLDNLKKTAETERKLYDARQKDIQNAQKNIVNAYENAADDILDAIKDLQNRQQTLADKLIDFGGVMENVVEIEDKFSDVHSPITEKDGRYVLQNLGSQTRELEKYFDLMTKLRGREGMSAELFDVIKNMGYEESLAYAQKLMRMGDRQFSNYIESWQKKQETSKRITEELFGDDGSMGAKRVLSDLKNQTNVLKDYYSLLDDIKNRAEVPEEFFSSLRDMGIEEGLEYANALLELSDEDFANYIKSWEEKQKTSQLISKELYKEEAEQLASEIGDKFDEVEKEFFDVGENAADQFESGFLEQLKTVISNINGTISGAFSNVGIGITPDYGSTGYSINVPALARGSVLPGGKPFLAIVNDQPRGQTNVEAPLQTIVDAMNIALNNRGDSEVIREEHYNLNETELMTILHKLVKGGERLQGKSLISGGVY